MIDRVLLPENRAYVAVSHTARTSWTWEEAQKQGFVSKAEEWKWTAAELSKLRNVVKDISLRPNQVHTANVYYWISHYKFDGKISKKCIKLRVNKLMSQVSFQRKLERLAKRRDAGEIFDSSEDDEDSDSESEDQATVDVRSCK